MFAAARIVETSVFARLPEEFKTSDREQRMGGYPAARLSARSLLEGPSFDRDGNLWCVDVLNGRIFTVTRRGVQASSRNTTAGRTG